MMAIVPHKREIENLSTIRKECVIDKFIIMPNHIHLILQIIQPENRSAVHNRADCHPPLRESVSNMVQGLKGAVTREIEFSPWQRSFYDHVIRDEFDYNRIVEYIENNPANWVNDCLYVRDDNNRPVTKKP